MLGTRGVRRAGLLGAASVASLWALAALAAPAAAAGGPRGAERDGRTYLAVGVPVCPPVAPGHATCDALRRELVPVGTPGARPFEAAGGARGSGTLGPDGGLTPHDLALAYRYQPQSGGLGQTIALVDAYNDPHLNSDLKLFNRHYHLPACNEGNSCLRVVGPTGSARRLARDDTSGWSQEEALDVEVAHAVCHRCHLLLVEAASTSDVALGSAVDEAVKLGATEVSNSYGGPESADSPQVAADYDHPGVVITAAAGDDGWDSYDLFEGVDEPDTPAAYPTVVSVGGTTLELRSNGRRKLETVWNDNGLADYDQELLGMSLGASGGGCSTIWPAPPWQTAQPGYALAGCQGRRLENDVAAVASPITGFDIYDSYRCGRACPQTGWLTFGGTSLATPIISGLYALAGGAHGVPYPALDLYGHRGATYDVQRGGNGWCGGLTSAQCPDPNGHTAGLQDCAYGERGAPQPTGACDATVGFDGPTGVGTPIGTTAFERTGPTGTVSGPASLASGTTGTWNVSVHDPFPGGIVVRYVWRFDDGSPPITTTQPTASHAFVTTGRHQVSVTLLDSYGMTGAARAIVRPAGTVP